MQRTDERRRWAGTRGGACGTRTRTTVTAAKIGDHAPKDLRDTFACHLLTAGISLGYIAEQLGHANPQVTARHYARWVGEEYREPLTLRDGEVASDLLARFEKDSRHTTPQRKNLIA